MTLAIFAAVLFSLAAGLAFARVFRHLAADPGHAALPGGRLFSPEKYRPMERLLDEADFAFLAAHAAYYPRMARRLRAERRRVFRGYLRSLERDFSRTCGAIQVLMAASAEDRPDLAAALVRQRVRFAYGILRLRVRLALDAAGWHGVEVRPLLDSLASLHGELGKLAAVPAAA